MLSMSKGPRAIPIRKRFIKRFEPHPISQHLGHPCWRWTGAITKYGYGCIHMSAGLGPARAHRVAWELFVGEIPTGMTLDHLCRNRACVNPSHLEVVTNRENILRGESPPAKRARQKRCHRGHELTGLDSRGFRFCDKCRSWAMRHKHQKTMFIDQLETLV